MIIYFQVIDKDTISKDDPMGEVQIPLWETDLYNVNDQVVYVIYVSFSIMISTISVG